MNEKFNINDCHKLAEILASHEISVIPTDWMELFKKWKKKQPDFVVNTMIGCFCRFTLEEIWSKGFSQGITERRKKMEAKLEKLVFDTYIKEMPLYAVGASLDNPEGIFAEWRLKINK